MEALVRLAPTSGTRKFDSRSKRLGGGYNKALPPQDKVANMERCRQIERITEACTLLLERGITGKSTTIIPLNRLLMVFL